MKANLEYYRNRPEDYSMNRSSDGKRVTIKYLHAGVNWDDEEARIARGLVVEVTTGEIIAKPYDKFFNANQTLQTPEMTAKYTKPKAMPFVVTEKLDGSLGIAYNYDGLHFGSTGNPDFEQFGNWKEKFIEIYPDLVDALTELTKTYTVLFEVMDPDHQIVIPAEKFDFRVTGMVETKTGRDLSELEIITVLKNNGLEKLTTNMAPVYHFDSFADIMDTIKNFKGEGFVVRYDDGSRLKIKTEEYVKAHHVMTLFGVPTIKRVIAWIMLYENGELDDIFAQLVNNLYVDPNAENNIREMMTLYSQALDVIESAKTYIDGKTPAEIYRQDNLLAYLGTNDKTDMSIFRAAIDYVRYPDPNFDEEKKADLVYSYILRRMVGRRDLVKKELRQEVAKNLTTMVEGKA